jgi:hypothetical protein
MAEPTLFAECLYCEGDGNPAIQKDGGCEFYVQCQRCSCCGPYAPTVEEAIEKWLAVHGGALADLQALLLEGNAQRRLKEKV